MTDLFNEKGEPASLNEIIDWWLERYEGMEHLTEGGNIRPEVWYTISVILRRCLNKIRQRGE